MTELIRIAKSGNDWTTHELAAYNLIVEYQDATTFFGIPNLPQSTVNPAVLTVTNPDDASDACVYELLYMMDLAMSLAAEEGSIVSDFTALLLRMLGYTPKGRVIMTRKNIPFITSGENRLVQTDVCIVDQTQILLLIQEDRRHLDFSDPEPQLVAKAIAAIAENNLIRQQTLNLPPLASKIMAGVIVKDTNPTFYKIRVTTALVACVAGGVYPQEATTIYAHVPNIPRPNYRLHEGMKPLDNRQAILSSYEAFKQFVN